MFRFADKTDVFLLIVGIFSALAMGAVIPLFSLLWGDITDTFSEANDQLV